MARSPRPCRALLRACAAWTSLLGVVFVLLMPTVAAQADTPWGATGASYRSGLICALPDGRRVALASWAVGGTAAFSVADVVARGSSYGPAPRDGAARDLAPGTRGLGAADLAALAYLIGHSGAGTPAQVAETSALVAQSFGGGAAQQQCLGRQGTSAAAASTLALAARRFAGPYTVQVPDIRAKPGSSATVTATVRSAAGVPTPGVTVSFAASGTAATGVTGADGRASVRLVVAQDGGPLTAIVAEPTGLRLVGSAPESVILGAAQPVVARASEMPVLHPDPQLSISGGTALVLAGGSLTPTATVTGTYGYAGTGTLAVLGPVQPPSGATCSDVSFGAAASVWSGTFAFTGDGPKPTGSTGALRPGCYAFAGSVVTTDATPAVAVKVDADPARAVIVSALQVTQSVGSGIARAGPLTATVTATAAAGASVSSTVTTYGPLPAATGGHCDTGLPWTGAKVFARSAGVSLAAQGSDRLTAAVRTPAVAATGCYALVARSTVTQAGRSAVVSAAPGAAGTTVTVIAPTVRVTNSAYDGRQGVPMAGTVHVTGTIGLAGSVAVGLVSAPAPATGCHGVTFPAAATSRAGATTTVATSGDGDYRFRSPVPGQNRCYGVVATLAMSADPTVRVDSPAPGDTAVFLAGATPPVAAQIQEHEGTASRPARAVAVFGVTAAVVLGIALALMIGAAVAGERKPDPRAGELLVEFTV